MNFFEFLIGVDARTVLMERMMRKIGVGRQLKTVADHAAVINRAVDRCRSCGHQGECAAWLDETVHADHPPAYCRNGDLIARLQSVR